MVVEGMAEVATEEAARAGAARVAAATAAAATAAAATAEAATAEAVWVAAGTLVHLQVLVGTIISDSIKIVGPRCPIVSIYIPLLMFIKRTLRLRGAQALGSEKL